MTIAATLSDTPDWMPDRASRFPAFAGGAFPNAFL
jgi:hypothetical protein